MNTTIIHASEELAKTVAEDLLNRKSKNGNLLFKQREIENGFEIYGYKQGVENLAFRYINDEGRKRFDYNEKLLTFFWG